MKIGVTGNPRKREIAELIKTVKRKVPGESLIFDSELSPFLVKGDKSVTIDELPLYADVLLSFGGDGTLLRTARYSRGLPIAGVNIGGLGFLTVFRVDEVEKLVDNILAGNFRIEERMVLRAFRPSNAQEFIALNDISIRVTGSSRMIDIEVFTSGELLNRYRADGVIVATPTGSTAYNLAAGGPIVYPGMNAIIITPICAHTLSVRPVILPSNIYLKITSSSKGEEKILLSADGQDEVMLENGESIEITECHNRVKLIRLKDTPGFFEVLRTKLGWG